MRQATMPTCEYCLPTLEGKILLCKLHAATAELLRTAKCAHSLLLFKRFIGFTKELEEFGQAIAKAEGRE